MAVKDESCQEIYFSHERYFHLHCSPAKVGSNCGNEEGCGDEMGKNKN